MSRTGTIVEQVSIAGLSFGATITRREAGAIAQEVSLAAGKSGTLSTRTDDDTGVVTLAEGHGITDSDTVDVHWDDADGVHQVQYSCTVTAYDGTTVSIDAGSGVNLPDAESTVVICAQQTVDTDFDGDLMAMIVVACDQDAHIDFQENDTTSLLGQILDANESWHWVSGQGVANPLTGNPVGVLMVSNGSTTAATLRMGVIYDSDG